MSLLIFVNRRIKTHISHLIAMFNGGFAVLQSGSYDEPAPRNALFQIRLNRANQIKVFEVGCSAENLNSNDTFLAVKEGESSYGFSGESFAWIGRLGCQSKFKFVFFLFFFNFQENNW